MIQRRGLFGFLAAAPAIIAADRLMPVRSPRPMRLLTERDLFFQHTVRDYGFQFGVMAQFVGPRGETRRHGVVISADYPPTPVQLAEARQVLVFYANEVRRLHA